MILAGVIITLLIIGGFYNFTHSKISPTLISISKVDVQSDFITLNGSLAGSAMWHNGYKVTFKDSALYVDIMVSPVQLPGRTGDIVVSIPNKYGTVKKIYLTGHNSEEDKMIWAQ